MNIFLQILAYILALSLVSFLLIIAFESLLEAYGRFLWKKNYDMQKLGKLELARQLGLYSYWLSESPEIHKAIKKLSTHIISNSDANFNAEEYRRQINENN